ncbi:hypothetical protein [Ornithinibacillus halotolerans]|uniref:Uncharacterized protein n=1 Tax=Ornithinibacillus halotolerans TaxID=1274357 RepID=A0A916RXV8_9BACI|nr:hypothetical protein [Ornithinibacillus halotolerans]GGA71572.1 hypothetical protein GCM10008025_14350 [Ornithinibacillus halotolerans]
MNLEKEVSKLTKKELVDLVMELADSYQDVARTIEFKLSTPSDELKASKQLIRKYINENKRQGFIAWRNVHAALQGVEMVLDKGRNKLNSGEEEMAVKLGIAVLSNVIDMLQYTDDSGGEIGFTISQTITLLNDASSLLLLSTNNRVQERTFNLILKEAMHKRYDGWSDTRYELLDVCTIYSARTTVRRKLEETVEKLLNQLASIPSRSSDHDKEALLQIQLKILERNGEVEQATEFVYNHLEYDSFRKMAIEKEMELENYKSALDLCIEGEEKYHLYPGLVKEWKKYRLQIYEETNNIEKQKELLLEFVLDNQYDAYRKLKELYSNGEWQNVLEDIFLMFEEKTEYLPHVYEYIAQSENRSDKILNYVEQSPSTILELYRDIKEDYPEKMEEIFTNYLLFEANNARDRREYKAVCKKLLIYKEACGDNKFEQLVIKLKDTYERKPAFINELDKIEKLA